MFSDESSEMEEAKILKQMQEYRSKIIDGLKPGACYRVDQHGRVIDKGTNGEIVNKCGPGFKCEESCPTCRMFKVGLPKGVNPSELKCTKISKRSADEERMQTKPPKILLKFID